MSTLCLLTFQWSFSFNIAWNYVKKSFQGKETNDFKENRYEGTVLVPVFTDDALNLQ